MAATVADLLQPGLQVRVSSDQRTFFGKVSVFDGAWLVLKRTHYYSSTADRIPSPITPGEEGDMIFCLSSGAWVVQLRKPDNP